MGLGTGDGGTDCEAVEGVGADVSELARTSEWWGTGLFAVWDATLVDSAGWSVGCCCFAGLARGCAWSLFGCSTGIWARTGVLEGAGICGRAGVGALTDVCPRTGGCALTGLCAPAGVCARTADAGWLVLDPISDAGKQRAFSASGVAANRSPKCMSDSPISR